MQGGAGHQDCLGRTSPISDTGDIDVQCSQWSSVYAHAWLVRPGHARTSVTNTLPTPGGQTLGQDTRLERLTAYGSRTEPGVVPDADGAVDGATVRLQETDPIWDRRITHHNAGKNSSMSAIQRSKGHLFQNRGDKAFPLAAQTQILRVGPSQAALLPEPGCV